MSSAASRTLIAYLPVPHRGYLELLGKYPDSVYVLGKEFVGEFISLTRNLPAVAPEEACRMVQGLGFVQEVRVLSPKDLPALAGRPLVLPDEEVSRAFCERHLSDADVEFDGSWRLRWHWDAVNAHRVPDIDLAVSQDELDRELLGKARAAAERSPDWWRQVGAVLSRDGVPLLAAYNTHLPSEQSAYVYGDPRSNFGPGERIDATLSLHAEIGIIAEAARRGIATDGGDLYVTTFPCPPCASAVAVSGIRRLYFADGYSLVAGAETLRSRNIEIIRVV